jgi:phosphate:Na+ symporter
MNLVLAQNLLGGMGLFLMGMWLLSDGLKLAGGRALRSILSHGTATPLRGLLSGVFITSLVQSSSAVTVAAIGFVNAGLISLRQAVRVIYGSNIGTTMTGWLVAFIGLQIDIKVFALPLIGIGMLLRLSGGGTRRGAAGMAVAGFGLFFVGIDFLRLAFSGVGENMPLHAVAGGGLNGAVLAFAAGVLITVLMQSSSAAMALILTAAAGGALPLAAAAAMVVGTNIGTTSTAVFAALGATPNARRVAAAHVAFNVMTALVALVLLSLLIWGFKGFETFAARGAAPAIELALFHTVFNILGVILMWPVTGRLVNFLERRFRSREEDESQPRYLDRNVVTTPLLAMHALVMELGRMGGIALRIAKGAMSTEVALGQRLEADSRVLDRLIEAVGEFCALMQRSSLPAELDEVLPNALRVSRYYSEMAELARRIAAAQTTMEAIEAGETATAISHFRATVVKLLDGADAASAEFSRQGCAEQLTQLEEEYQRLKSQLLRSGAAGELPIRRVVAQLDVCSDMRRLAEQAEKGGRYLDGLQGIAVPTQAQAA